MTAVLFLGSPFFGKGDDISQFPPAGYKALLSSGLTIVGILGVALIFCGLTGVRVDGWGGVCLGAAGIVYCYTSQPAYILIVVFPLSALLLAIGVTGLVVRRFFKRT